MEPAWWNLRLPELAFNKLCKNVAGVLGCPRKLGSMVSKWVISPQYIPFISR